MKNADGRTQLMTTCRYSNTNSNIETVKLLLDAGANIDLQNSNGWTALMLACRYSNTHTMINIVYENYDHIQSIHFFQPTNPSTQDMFL